MKFALISLGCSKNLVDSENFIGILVNKRGFEVTSELGEADIIIVNTCGFIGDAKKESIETILEVSDLKINGNLKKIIVTGCLAQRYAGEILKELPEVDAVIGTGEIDKIEKEICDYIIDSLDEDGYLRIDEKYIIDELNITNSLFEMCLKIVQQLEPVGVGARNLSECLIIQMRNLGIDNALLETIVSKDLELIGKNKYKEITKKYNISMQKCVNLINIIKTLDPKPGRVCSDEKSVYIQPDVVVEKIEDEFIVYMNESDSLKIRISNFYKEILKNSKYDESTKNFIKEKLNSATGLVKSIESRKSTILKIAKEILKNQKDFFEKGEKYIKPMKMKDIAQNLDFHESTISRGVNGKYMLTPFGIYEFKYFFSSALETNYDNLASSVSIKRMIQETIKSENKKKPLSDDQISKILNDRGINIARRTIAKYREELGILSSSKRKQY